MTDDRILGAVSDLASRGRPRGPVQVLSDATSDSEAVRLITSAGPRRRGLRVFQVSMAVAVAVAVVLGLIAMSVIPGRSTLGRATNSVLGDRGSPYDKQLDEWLAGYDPAEVKFLRDTYGQDSKQYEISVLEFRRTCRKMSAAIDAAATASPDDRSTTVHEIMDPQLDRSDARDLVLARADGQEAIFGDGSMAKAWRTMANDLAAGNDGPARSFVASDCGDAIGPWVDT